MVKFTEKIPKRIRCTSQGIKTLLIYMRGAWIACISLAILPISSCSRNVLSEDLSVHPVDPYISSCLMMYGVNAKPLNNNTLKNCLMSKINRSIAGDHNLVNGLGALGFYCDIARSRCDLDSVQRLYGINNNKYVEFSSRISLTFEDNKVNSLLVEQKTVGADGAISGPYATDKYLP